MSLAEHRPLESGPKWGLHPGPRVTQNSGPLSVLARPIAPFRSDTVPRSSSFGDVAISWASHKTNDLARANWMRNASRREATVIVVLEGGIHVRQGAANYGAQAGDVLVVSGETPYSVLAPLEAEAISVTIGSSLFDRIGRLGDPPATGVVAPNTLIAPLAEILRALLLIPPTASAAEAACLQRCLLQLLIGVLGVGSGAGARHPMGQPRRNPGELMDAAFAVIVERSAEVRFDVPRLAAAIGTSTRNLQRIFAIRKTTPYAEIRAERTRIAAGLILSDSYTRDMLPDIADRAGFGSVKRLARAFEAVHAMSIREYRASQRT